MKIKLKIKYLSIRVLIGICLIVVLQKSYNHLKTHTAFKFVVFNKDFSLNSHDSDLLWAQNIVKGGYFFAF